MAEDKKARAIAAAALGETTRLSSSIADKQSAFNKGWTILRQEVAEGTADEDLPAKIEFNLPDIDISELYVRGKLIRKNVGANSEIHMMLGNVSPAAGASLVVFQMLSSYTQEVFRAYLHDGRGGFNDSNGTFGNIYASSSIVNVGGSLPPYTSNIRNPASMIFRNSKLHFAHTQDNVFDVGTFVEISYKGV